MSIILRRFIPVPLYFTVGKKITWLIKKHPECAGNVVISLLSIWGQCRDRYQDGILHMDEEEIEVTFKWLGKTGELMPRLTDERTKFLVKISDNEYHVHDWYKNNPDMNIDQQENTSKQNSINANIGHQKTAKEMLLRNGFKKDSEGNPILDECKWFYYEENEGYNRLSVELKHIPEYMNINGMIFHSREEFSAYFKYHCNNKKTKDAIFRDIKKHTKRCKKCKTMHIDQLQDICSECRGL